MTDAAPNVVPMAVDSEAPKPEIVKDDKSEIAPAKPADKSEEAKKKKRARREGPSYFEMIVKAILALKSQRGASSQAIRKVGLLSFFFL